MTDNPFSLWVYLSQTPLLWLSVTLAVYAVADALSLATHRNPLMNPVLHSIWVIGIFLYLTGTSYTTYFSGAQFVHFLLGPATVALAVPLYENRERVAAAFDDPKEFERFAAFMDNELKMARTNAEVNPRGNSITAKLLMQNAEPAPVGPVLQGARAALRGDPLGFVASLMPNKPQPGSLNAQTAAEMAPYLFSLKPGDRARLIDALIAQEGRDTKVKRIADPVANALMRGATVGAVQLEN